jgi:hypothetical protein
MVIEIFNGEIGVPAKCGTRFFSKTVKSPEREVGYWTREVSGMPNEFAVFRIPTEVAKWKKLKYFVIREPFEHLKSALHTDMVTCWEDLDKVNEILNKYLNEYGDTHYHPTLYKSVYEVFREWKMKVKCIDISNVSEFVQSKGFDIPYNKEEYAFKHTDNWKSKEECVEIVQTNFTDKWNQLVDKCKRDREYYEYLLHGRSKLI